MIKCLTDHFCAYCYYTCVTLDGVVIALKSTIGKNLIIGDLVHVYTKKIPDSKNKIFEIVKIDLKNGISVRSLEKPEEIFLLNTDEIVVF
ncbi:hypothetical protein EOM09_03890 [bacterium]|nr:hypothetical protein [bacterium]